MAAVDDVPRLCEALAANRRAGERFRSERREAVRHYIGKHWNTEGSHEPVPINVLAQYCRIITRNLIAKDPRFLLSTFAQQHKPAVAAMQEWLNREAEKMHLGETFQRVVFDALFSLGIAKVALSTPQDAALAAWTTQAGKPFAERVDIDDFGFDVHARSFLEADMLFHRYRVPLDTVRDDKRFSKGRLELRPQDQRRYNAEGDERIGNLGRGWRGDDTEYRDWIDLWEVYLPKDRVVVTLLDNMGVPCPDKKGDPLLEQKWVGPECGPYHFLCFGIVPGNAWPKAPIMDLLDLAKSINGIAAKLILQAQSQKDLLLVQSGATATGQKLANAKDGDVLDVDRPEAAKQQSLGGPNPVNAQYLGVLQQVFDEQAGNLRTMGGLATGAKTATQENLLNQNSSASTQDLQEQVVRHASSVGYALNWFYWHNPSLVMQSSYAIPGSPGLTVDRSVHPWNHPDPQALKRDGPMPDVKCDPFSLRKSSPQQKVQQLDEMMQKIILPMMPFLQQQGKVPDIDYYLRRRAELLDDPDLVDLMQVGEPPPPEPQGQEQPGMPANTSREYVRRDAGNPDSEGAQNNERDNLISQMAAASGRNGQPSANGSGP